MNNLHFIKKCGILRKTFNLALGYKLHQTKAQFYGKYKNIK